MPKNVSPEGVAESVGRLIQAEAIRRLVIQTHYGNHVLPVAEIWPDDETRTLHITVDLPPEVFQ